MAGNAKAKEESPGKCLMGSIQFGAVGCQEVTICNPRLDFFARSMHAGKSKQASHLKLWQWTSNGWYWGWY
jgi:hypothetical protein